MAKHDAAAMAAAELTETEREVRHLRKELDELKALEAKRWRILENFLAKFGTYFNSEGSSAFFVVDKFVNGGANGVALTPQQGLLEHFALPMHIRKDPAEKVVGPCWVPEIIPEQTAEEIIELFDAGQDADGPDNKAVA